MELIITRSFSESSRYVADQFRLTVEQKPDSLLGCATGGSTEELYRYMIEDYKNGRMDFSRTRTVNLDEYIGLPRSHRQSFGCFMDTHFFRHVNLQPENIFLLDGAGEVEEELLRFNRFINRNRIDILMVGIGTNGHIGFNEPDRVFPASARAVELEEDTIKANARFFDSIDEVPRRAITMGMLGIVKARKVVLIATGASKADAIGKLLREPVADPMLPCSILHLCADATVVIDEELHAMACGGA